MNEGRNKGTACLAITKHSGVYLIEQREALNNSLQSKWATYNRPASEYNGQM